MSPFILLTMPNETIASEVLAASIGGAISASILYPLEVLKTKMQAVEGDGEDEKDQKNDDMITFSRKLYERESMVVFFRGMETSAFQSALEKALYFFAYTFLKEAYGVLTGHRQLGAVPNLALGCMAEWAHLPISMPIDYMTTQIQTSTDAPLKVLLNMLSMKNKAGTWYKGIQAYYVLCFKPALQYTIFEQVKAIWVKSRKVKTLGAAEAFFLGIVARTVATILCFPYLRAKVLMQKAKSDESAKNDDENGTAENQPPVTMGAVLWAALEADGMAGLYQGLGPELTRGIFSAGLMLMIKERISGTVRQLLGESR